ncbi:MAG: hypothetical protein Q8J68_06440 [Methanolobus sp.]|uniref:hypothetical protein n=1 Tax=Methanolobus sp. TaxID=1874737 RepID=UPI0027312E37|nr:hypothetical protein [Methanolobus sp.]MDP2216905.1 hypothetical protein [Methanolobus sp.]
MQFFDAIGNMLNIVLIIVNVIFISILICQFREAKKPILSTHIVSNLKNEIELSDVLESTSAYNFEHQYIRITNVSKNEAKKLKLTYRISLKDDPAKSAEKTEELDYLNPSEMAQFSLYTKIVRDKFPDQFETVNLDDNTTLIRPKGKLEMNLDLFVEYNPLFLNIKKHTLKDSYTIEWSKLESEPYVVFNNWNKRNSHYISKKNVITKMGAVDDC